jgi:hypothetical protein
VIRVEDRDPYLAALDRASIDMDIKPFVRFVAQRVKWSLEQRKRELKFPEPKERYIFDRKVVAFSGQDGATRVRCEISEEALEDHFGGNGKDKVKVFRANRKAIEEIARRIYLADRTERDGSVLIHSADL